MLELWQRKFLECAMKKTLIKIIKKYQHEISPFFVKHGYKCLFNPSCSQYSIECLEKYNLFKAILLICYRLLSCNPVNAFIKHRNTLK